MIYIFADEGHEIADMLKIANLLIKVNVVIKPRILSRTFYYA